MGFDAFVKIDGIEGVSTDSRYSGWIEILEYDLDVSQRISKPVSSSGGASVERVDFSEFTFSKLLDKASPRLALCCADGTHIDAVTIDLCRAGGDKLRFMAYTLSNCIISSFSTSCADTEFPVDNVAVNFGRIQWCYTQQDRMGGGAAGSIAAGWNLEKNCRA